MQIIVLIVLATVEAYIIQATAITTGKKEPIRVACVGDSITKGTEYTLYLWN
ncbi:MAG: hypothetical protein WC046_02470 [Candidatus Bathyarchaeia archaeon]|jgi:hypothetical protein